MSQISQIKQTHTNLKLLRYLPLWFIFTYTSSSGAIMKYFGHDADTTRDDESAGKWKIWIVMCAACTIITTCTPAKKRVFNLQTY